MLLHAGHPDSVQIGAILIVTINHAGSIRSRLAMAGRAA
jgi:hypothetical protein